MWGAVGAGNHFGGFVTCQQLAGPSEGKGHGRVDTGCARWAAVLVRDLAGGCSQPLELQLHVKAQNLPARTRVLPSGRGWVT